MESDEAAAAASPQATTPSGGTGASAPKKRGRKPKSKDDSQTPSSQQQSGGKMKESGKKTTQQPSVDEKYSQWKGLVPILYDWLANHNLVWPSLSCRSPFFSISSRVSFYLCLPLNLFFLRSSLCEKL